MKSEQHYTVVWDTVLQGHTANTVILCTATCTGTHSHTQVEQVKSER